MKYFFAAMLTTFTITVNGQSNRFDVGMEGGISLASLRGNALVYEGHHSRMGYIGGLFGQYNFPRHFSIRTGCYFERKGSSLKLSFVDMNGTPVGTMRGRESFDYITVPLLFRYNFGKKINCFVNAGPFVGFLLKQTEYTEALLNIPESTSDRTANFQETEAGVSFGAGINYPVSEKYMFSFEVRNNLGLTNVSALPILGGDVIKTNALNFLVGFNYRLGNRINK
jgi:hypothetical protein